MICPFCHANLVQRSRFCQWCGRRLEVPCEHCGQHVNLVDKFCQWCGISLDSLKERIINEARTHLSSTEPISSGVSSPLQTNEASAPTMTMHPSMRYHVQFSRKKSAKLILLFGVLTSIVVVMGTWLFTANLSLSLVALMTILPMVTFWAILKYFNERSRTNQQLARHSVVLFVIFGVLIIIPIIVAELMAAFGITLLLLLVVGYDVLVSAFALLVVAAFIEEVGKLVLIKKAVRDNGTISIMRAIYFGIMAVLAFAIVENIFYVLGALEGGIENAFVVSIVRSLLSVPLHVLTASFIVKNYLRYLRENPHVAMMQLMVMGHFRPIVSASWYMPLSNAGVPNQPWSVATWDSRGHQSSVNRWHYLGIPSVIHLAFNMLVFFLSSVPTIQLWMLVIVFLAGLVVMYGMLYRNFKWFWYVKDMTLHDFISEQPHV